MIYRTFLKKTSNRKSTEDTHNLGIQLVAHGLLLEKGIVYKSEPVIRNPWGKPYLKNYPDIHYNISHSADLVACVISDTNTVGIDVEKIRSFNQYAAKRVCSSEELNRVYLSSDTNREFFRYWTLKESYIKAIGKGISYHMRSANFYIGTSGEVQSNLSDCSFQLIEDIEEYITAVCYLKISGKE